MRSMQPRSSFEKCCSGSSYSRVSSAYGYLPQIAMINKRLRAVLKVAGDLCYVCTAACWYSGFVT